MPEITVTVTRNDKPTVEPTNWDNFENNRVARWEETINNPTIGSQQFAQVTAARLHYGMKTVKNGK